MKEEELISKNQTLSQEIEGKYYIYKTLLYLSVGSNLQYHQFRTLLDDRSPSHRALPEEG